MNGLSAILRRFRAWLAGPPAGVATMIVGGTVLLMVLMLGWITLWVWLLGPVWSGLPILGAVLGGLWFVIWRSER